MENKAYYQFSTAELLEYVIKNIDNQYGSTVEAVIYNGEIKCTHFFDYLADEGLFTHEGIDGEEEKLTQDEIMGMYPKTLWTVHLD